MQLLATVDVARALDLSVERIRQLDEELRPLRVGARRARAYLSEAVDVAQARRDAARAAKGHDD